MAFILPSPKVASVGGSDIVVGCDCIDLNQLAPLDFGLLAANLEVLTCSSRATFSKQYQAYRPYVIYFS
jgi:hypothetical protein